MLSIHFLRYNLTLKMHLLYTPQTQLSFRLIVRTLSAPVYLSNSPGVFGHSDYGEDRAVAGGFLIEQTDLFHYLSYISQPEVFTKLLSLLLPLGL